MSHRLSHHKLRIVVHVDVVPGNIAVEVGGCLTRANFPALLNLLLRAQRLAASPDIAVDLRRAIHLDAGVLEHLRGVADPGRRIRSNPAHPSFGLAAAAALIEADFRLTLAEPAYLPVCPIHSANPAAARRDAASAAVVGHPNQPTDPAHPVRPARADAAKRSTRERAVKALRAYL